jgi:hypothetical protein
LARDACKQARNGRIKASEEGGLLVQGAAEERDARDVGGDGAAVACIGLQGRVLAEQSPGQLVSRGVER